MKKLATSLAAIALLSACSADATIAVEVDSIGHAEAASCEDRFAKHALDHTTTGASSGTTLFDGTGSGVAVGDLTNDGYEDLVFANLSGESSVFVNRLPETGRLEFERSALTIGRYRHVAIVDVTSDGWNDIVLTTGVGRPVLATNDGEAGFSVGIFPGIDAVAYSMGWVDLGGDGDLDLVTGAYNAELTANRDVSALLGNQGGVSVYERIDGSWQRTRLTPDAQALAIRLADINYDGLADIHVGNDLITPDALWVAADEGWDPVEPFSRTTFSTMSLDGGDIDNDGRFEILATDMHPMDDDPATVEAWEPVMQDMMEMPEVDDVQHMENVLSTPDGDSFDPITNDFGIGFTGWSWSGEFGDLDNDGFVDLYVVNGMESEALFGHITPSALIEPNQAFRNLAGTSMEPAPEWGLADTDGGRGMIMADLDRDGDLDIAINNLNAPAAVFENRLCAGNAITVDLIWEGTGNRPAISSTVVASTNEATHTRLVEATRGYLSGYAGGVHIGIGDAQESDLTITWPDGAVSEVDDVPARHHLVITRSE